MKNLVSILIVVLLFVSCSKTEEKIHGNGQVEAKKIEIQDYSQVQVNGAYELFFIQDSTWQVKVEAESNLLPLIKVYKSGGKLIIEEEEGYSLDPEYSIRIKIHHAGLDQVDFNGAGLMNFDTFKSDELIVLLAGTCSVNGNFECNELDFIIAGTGFVDAALKCNELETSVSGTGNLNFKGNSHKVILNISGSANVQALNLNSNIAWCTISGIGDAFLNVNTELNATIIGTGNIKYKGSPIVNKSVTGLGDVNPLIE